MSAYDDLLAEYGLKEKTKVPLSTLAITDSGSTPVPATVEPARSPYEDLLFEFGLDKVAPPQEAPIPSEPPGGYTGTMSAVEDSLLEKITNPLISGYKKGKTAMSEALPLMGGSKMPGETDADVQRRGLIAKRVYENDALRQAEKYGPSLEDAATLEAMSKAKNVSEWLGAVTPSAFYNVMADSMGQQAIPLLAMVASAPAGPVAQAVFSYNQEYLQILDEEIRKKGGDPSDPVDYARYLGDEKFISEVKGKAQGGAASVAMWDALGSVVAGKFFKGTGLPDALKRTATDFATGAISGGAGEAQKQLVTEGEITSVGDILTEMAAEAPGSVAEGIGHTLGNKASELRASVEPTGDPDFDAGQIAAAEDMVASDVAAPEPSTAITPMPVQDDLFSSNPNQIESNVEQGQKDEELRQKKLEDEAAAQIKVQKEKEALKDVPTEESALATALKDSGALDRTFDRPSPQKKAEAPQEAVEAVQEKLPLKLTVDEQKVAKTFYAEPKDEPNKKDTAATRRSEARTEFIKSTIAEKIDSGVPRKEAIQQVANVDLKSWEKQNPVTTFAKKKAELVQNEVESPVVEEENADLKSVNFDELRAALKNKHQKKEDPKARPSAKAIVTEEPELAFRTHNPERPSTELPDLNKARIGDMKEGYGVYTTTSERHANTYNIDGNKTLSQLNVPSRSTLIDFDSAVGDQPQTVIDSLIKDDRGVQVLSSLPDNATGRDIYESVAKSFEKETPGVPLTHIYKKTSEYLRGLGIKGNMKYAPLGKRTGDRDFTIFDPKDLVPPSRKSGGLGKIDVESAPDGATAVTESLRKKGATVQSVLDTITKTAKGHLPKALSSYLSGLGLKTKIDIAEGSRVDTDGKRILGEYEVENDTITLWEDSLSESDAVVAWLIQHEATHAATEKLVATPDKHLTEKQKDSKKQLQDLFDYVVKSGKIDPKRYGLTNTSEFMAEAFSNEKFQAELEAISLPKSLGKRTMGSRIKNLFDFFVDTVRSVLGLKPGEHNALSEAIRITGNIAENQIELEETTELNFERAAAAPAKASPKDIEIDMVNTEGARNVGVFQKGEYPSTPDKIKKAIAAVGRSGGSLNNVVREIIESGQTESQSEGLRSQQTGRRIQNYLDKNDPDGKLSEKLTEGVLMQAGAVSFINNVVKDHPILKSLMDDAILQIKLNAINMLEQSALNGIPVPKGVADKIIRSATDVDYLYVTRNYRKDDPKGAGQKYAEKIARAAEVHKGLDQVLLKVIDDIVELVNKATFGFKFTKRAAEIREYRDRAQKAAEYFIKNDLYIPSQDGLVKMSADKIGDLHEAYFGDQDKPVDVKRKDLLKKRQSLSKEQMQLDVAPRALQMVKDVLNLTDPQTVSKLSRYYGAGERADLTIISKRKDIPVEIRELMGEHRDAAYNIFSTLMKQTEFIAKQRVFQEINDLEGTHVFNSEDRNPLVHTEKLNGETFGALNGKYTTPEIKAVLDAKLEASETFSRIIKDVLAGKSSNWGQRIFGAMSNTIVRRVTSWGKLTGVAMNLAGIAMNASGSPLALLTDGNFSPKSWKKGAKVAAQMINLVDKRASSEEIFDAIRLGIADSVQVGEISNSELEAVLGTLSSNNPLLKAKNTVVDVFAVSDAWTKIANYYHQFDFLTKVYDKAGMVVDKATIERQAAERTKRTNLSYLRAPVLAKLPEATGLIWFTTYVWETGRSTLNSAKMVGDDFKRASSLKGQGATEAASMVRNHAIKRAAGLTAAVPLSGLIISALTSAAVKIMGLGIGDEDEDEKYIQEQAMFPDQAGALPITLWEGKVGDRIIWDMSRNDPRGPVNETIRGGARALMSGDVDKMWSSLTSGIIQNSYLPELYRVGKALVGAEKPRTRGPYAIEAAHPAAWEEMRTQMTNLGMSPGKATETGRGLFKLLPRSVSTITALGVDEYLGDAKEKPVALRMMQGLGFNFIYYNPEDSLNIEARGVYTKNSNDLRSDIQKYVSTSSKGVDKEVVDGMVLGMLKQEMEDWSSLRKKIKAAELAGLPKEEIGKILKEAGISQKAMHPIMRGEFIFNGVSVDAVKAWRQEELKGAGGDQKKRDEINDRYSNLIPEIIDTVQKYRDEFRFREGEKNATTN